MQLGLGYMGLPLRYLGAESEHRAKVQGYRTHDPRLSALTNTGLPPAAHE